MVIDTSSCAVTRCARRVSVIGAGKVGSMLAQQLADKNLADVVLLDVVDGLPQGIALDLMQAGGVEQRDRKVIGTTDYGATADSDVVVITAGRPRTPGMDRSELIDINAKIVATASRTAIAHSPNAILIIITNPLDVMTYLAWQATGLPRHRVIGMAGVLDTARLQTFISMALGVSMSDINALVIGSHGNTMLPLPRYSTVRGIALPKLMDAATIDGLVDRTRHGGAEIVGLLKTGGAHFAPAAAACKMVEAILRDQSRMITAAAYLNGEYGLNDVFIGVPIRLGCQGVEQILELDLTESERQALHTSAESIRSGIKRAMEMTAPVRAQVMV